MGTTYLLDMGIRYRETTVKDRLIYLFYKSITLPVVHKFERGANTMKTETIQIPAILGGPPAVTLDHETSNNRTSAR